MQRTAAAIVRADDVGKLEKTMEGSLQKEKKMSDKRTRFGRNIVFSAINS